MHCSDCECESTIAIARAGCGGLLGIGVPHTTVRGLPHDWEHEGECLTGLLRGVEKYHGTERRMYVRSVEAERQNGNSFEYYQSHWPSCRLWNSYFSTRMRQFALPPAPVPSTKAPTPAPVTKTPTPAPITNSPTPAPNNQAPSLAPNKQAPSPIPNKQAPSPTPNKQAPSPTSNKQAPSPAPTTVVPAPTPVNHPIVSPPAPEVPPSSDLTPSNGPSGEDSPTPAPSGSPCFTSSSNLIVLLLALLASFQVL
ncbi:hypothetical protein IC575_021804 [Cucumis melo]